jgi:hypothetical protein
VRWRLIDLAQWIFEEFRIAIAKQTLSRELRAMDYRKLSARPRHYAQAAGAIEDFNKASPRAWTQSLVRIEIWFADEARIGQKNKITRRWAKRGTRPSEPCDQRTASTYIFNCCHHAKAVILILEYPVIVIKRAIGERGEHRLQTFGQCRGTRQEAEVVDVFLSASHFPAVACAPRWETRAPALSPGDNVSGGASPPFNGGSADWRDLHLSVRPVFPGKVSLRRSLRSAATGAKLGSVRDYA